LPVNHLNALNAKSARPNNSNYMSTELRLFQKSLSLCPQERFSVRPHWGYTQHS